MFPTLLAQAEFLIDEAQHSLGVGAQIGEPLEVLGHGRVIAARIAAAEVRLDQRRQARHRARRTVAGPVSFQRWLTVLPLFFESTNGLIHAIASADVADRG